MALEISRPTLMLDNWAAERGKGAGLKACHMAAAVGIETRSQHYQQPWAPSRILGLLSPRTEGENSPYLK